MLFQSFSLECLYRLMMGVHAETVDRKSSVASCSGVSDGLCRLLAWWAWHPVSIRDLWQSILAEGHRNR
jgi:hypothetical protein